MADFPQIVALFQELDRTGSGTIGRDEMQAVLVSAWGWSPAEVEEVLAIYSDNSSNVVMYADFLMWLFGLDGSQEAAASVPVDAREEEEEELGEEAPATPADDKNTSEAASSVTAAALADAAAFKATALAPEVVEEEGKEEAASSLSDALSEEEVEGAALARTSRHEDLKGRKRIEAMRAVKEDGLRLKNCSSKLRGDKVVVLEAVKQNGWAFEHCSESLRNDKDVAREARTSFAAVALRASLLPLTQAALCPEGHLLTANFYSVTYHSRICRTCGATGTDWRCSVCNYDVCSECRCESLKSGAVESIAVPDDFVTLLVSALGAKGRSEGAENMVLEAKEARGILPAVALWSCMQSLQHPRLCKQGHPLKADSRPDIRCDNRCVPVGTNWRCSDCNYDSCSACHCRVPTAESVAVPVDFVNRVVSALGATGCSDAQEDLVFESTNRQAVQHWLQHNLPDVCKLLAEALRNNKDLAAEAVKRNGRALGLCSETLRNDEDLAIEAIKRNGEALKYCSEELKNRKDCALEALKSCSAVEVSSLFESLSKETQSNYDIALMALRMSSGEGCSTIYSLLSKELQDNETVNAVTALKSKKDRDAYGLFKTFSREVQNQKEVAIVALQRSTCYANDVFQLLTEELQTDKEVALEAVKNAGGALQYCSETLRNDKDVFTEAVKTWGFALQFCSETLRNDKDVCTEAVKNDGAALQYCSEALRNDKDVCTEAVKNDGAALQHCSEALRNDKDVCTEAVKQDGRALQFCSEPLRNDKDVATEAVKQDGGALQFCSEPLRNDKDVATEAVKQDGSALQFCSEPLRNDKDVATEAVKRDGLALQFCSEPLRNDKDFATEAAAQSVTALKFALGGLSQDRECLAAAGLLAAQDAVAKRPEQGILSVRFGFHSSASNLSTIVADELAKHPEMKRFIIYNPNLFSKKSCDPDYTNLAWPCRGTASTCRLAQNETTASPTIKSCWRYSFRYHQHLCKESGGFMLQVEEYSKLGPGQMIETEMAQQLGLKIFRLKWNHPEYRLDSQYIRSALANQVADTVLDWFDDEKRDTGITIFEAAEGYTSRRFGRGGW